MTLANELAETVPSAFLLKSFLIGIRFDFRVVSIIMIPLFILSAIPGHDLVTSRTMRKIGFIYISIVTTIMFFLHMVEIEFFLFFNTRLNGSALIWFDSPGDTLTMVWSSFPVLPYLLLYGAITTAFILLIRSYRNWVVQNVGPSSKVITLVWLPIVLAVFILGSIGRIYKDAPMRWGIGYFCEYNFANQLSLNPTDTFMRDVFYDTHKREQVQKLVDKWRQDDEEAVVRRLLAVSSDTENLGTRRLLRRVRFDQPNPDPPNVLLIMMESFGSTKVGCLLNEYPYDLTPGFDSLVKSGVLFTRFYSSATHTGPGLFNIMTGTPHIFGKVMFKQVEGHTSYNALPEILRNYGYRTLFFTTQDPHYDNMQGFLRANGMMEISSVDDYHDSLVLSWLGVPDHVMFDHAHKRLKELAQSDQKFFATLLSTSHHSPYLIPDAPFEHIPDSEPRHRDLNAMKYSDWAMTRLVRSIMDDPDFNNTLILVTADQGFKFEVCHELDISMIQVPLFVYHTDGHLPAGVRNDRVGSQLDFLPTILGQLQLDYDNYSFGKDLFDTLTPVQDFAFATSWYNIGYIEDDFFFTMHADKDVEYLFKLPDKQTNLLEQHPDIAARLKHRALSIYGKAFYDQQIPINSHRLRDDIRAATK